MPGPKAWQASYYEGLNVAEPRNRVTFSPLTETSDPGRGGTAPGAEDAPLPDWFERDTLEVLKRLSRRPIDPAPHHELLADLGFDSLQVLELVGELEDHFGVAVPLNALTHIRTVAQVIDEVRGLSTAGHEPATAERRS
jgi:acyl carrier protein